MHKKAHKQSRKWLCLDCGENTSQMKEHYFVNTSLWMAAVGSETGMLCIGCLETRIGRSLRAQDFTGAHINDYRRNSVSDRLRARLSSM